MLITYANSKVERYFTDYKKMQKKLPIDWVRSIKKHMDRLAAADTFGDFLTLGLGKPEELSGYNVIRYSIHIAPNVRLIVEPNATHDSIARLANIIPEGEFRLSMSSKNNPYVIGAWVRLCQQIDNGEMVQTKFDVRKIDLLIDDIKGIMIDETADVQNSLIEVMAKYGIDFAVVKNFRGAPVNGYITQKSDGIFKMVLTIRGAFADIFWFSLFHELGHIVNGDIGKTTKYLDFGVDEKKEKAADIFARDRLINKCAYEAFVEKGNYGISAIKGFALQQKVMPYIVIGRLQKEKRIYYNLYSEHKIRYKWVN